MGRVCGDASQPIVEEGETQDTIDQLRSKVEDYLASPIKKDTEISQARRLTDDLQNELIRQQAENQLLSDEAKELLTIATARTDQLQNI